MASGTVTNTKKSVRTPWSHRLVIPSYPPPKHCPTNPRNLGSLSGNVALLWGARDKLKHLCRAVPDEDLTAKDIIALIQKAAIAYAFLFYKYKEGEFPLAIWANLIRPRLLLLHGTDIGLFRRSEDDIIDKLWPPGEIGDGLSFDETILEILGGPGL